MGCMEMNTSDAARVLGLTLPVDEAAVRKAFASAVKGAHPDTGGAAIVSMETLKTARDVLIAKANGFKPLCPLCASTGVVRSRGFKPVACPKGCKVIGKRAVDKYRRV